MKRFGHGLGLTCFCVMLGMSTAPAMDRFGAPVQVTQASCRAMQATCAARCKQRVPDDKNCVSDHCTPKLVGCRQTGCWQEGKMYGGKETCNLSKS